MQATEEIMAVNQASENSVLAEPAGDKTVADGTGVFANSLRLYAANRVRRRPA